ncbi:MAG: molecular chaperone [Gammaproteobacteria bacterium]|nr:MAG: molecular chaperone [Gammaproteobacteria bacterium]
MASVSPARAQGDLLVAPTRVIINGAGNAEVVLSNIGDKPATYRISLELRRMEESGDFSEVDETAATESERAARDMVRFAPRRVTLLPGQPQAVRLSVRPPEGLPDGEYRVHMSFRAIPAAQLAETAEEAAIPASGVSIKLTPIYGITIPVFVRHGRLEAQAAIAGARLVRSEKQSLLEVDMTRTGKRSVYGELIGRNSRGEVVFSLRGIAIYPEVDRRKVHVRLNSEQIGKIQGPLKLEYRDLPENGGALLAEATVTVS